MHRGSVAEIVAIVCPLAVPSTTVLALNCARAGASLTLVTVTCEALLSAHQPARISAPNANRVTALGFEIESRIQLENIAIDGERNCCRYHPVPLTKVYACVSLLSGSRLLN